MTDQANEILDVIEFAERLQVSRATVFEWIRKGELLAGRHFFKVGRILRFRWSTALVDQLFEDLTKEVTAPENAKPLQKPLSPVKKASKKNHKCSAINWDF